MLISLGTLVSGTFAYLTMLVRSRRAVDKRALTLERLEHGDVSEQAMAAWMLGAFGAYRDFELLLDPALSDDVWLAVEGVIGLDTLWGAPAGQRLAWMLEAERKATRKPATAERTEELRIQAQHEAFDHARAYRMHVAASASLDPTIQEKARALLGRGGWMWAEMGGRLLGIIGTDESRQMPAEAMATGSRMEAAAAVYGWAYATPSQSQDLIRLAQHPVAHVRRDAVNAITAVVDGAGTDPEDAERAVQWALPVLERASRHPSASTRLRTALAAWHLGQASDGIVRPLLDDPAWGVRAAAMIGLYRIQAADWQQIAEEMLDSDREWVRRRASELLEADSAT